MNGNDFVARWNAPPMRYRSTAIRARLLRRAQVSLGLPRVLPDANV
jgi:hypothetical protein